jgi:DNA-binding transcriptional regulator GbsR (MarR family)
MIGALEGFISHDAATREATAQAFATELGVSKRTMQRALQKLRYRKVKPTFKPGLTAAMKKARLDFALDHRHWTLEDWKRVIWTDETSVILRH